MPESLTIQRQWRGLVHHAEARREKDLRMGLSLYSRAAGRSIVGCLAANYRERNTGLCVWCGDDLGSKRRRWHRDCLVAYWVARGIQRNMAGRPLIALGDDCADCGLTPATEVDHIVPLALARASGDWDRILAAYSPANLQGLCRDCHRAKTAADLGLIADAKGRPARPGAGAEGYQGCLELDSE